ncbi:DUF853 family protein [Verticiella sediminum]|uniref:DUF853 family protein n=1 Tax=Verticiella sediminum TaxID=1247510 RepID=A0A556ALS0_9BURK|nr:helicase HerA-like domain-containing protein [Verticiella sediminum]TSH93844.1 DUF853 family protein [Verticiella sediminum]
MPQPLCIARDAGEEICLLPGLANRHGCITGATGTGKTVTLQVMAEQLSRIGTPVFVVDVKGDLSGISQAGAPNPKLLERLQRLHLDEPAWAACPAAFWDVHGAQGHPVRATVSDMGPLLLARMLGLNDTQAGVLSVAFRVADDNGWLLLDMKDLRAILQYVAENASALRTQYGNVSSASVGAIQRALLTLEDQGGKQFFGEPMLDVDDLLQTVDGQGVVNILAADKLIATPRLYATFLLWLLAELFERLPEVGDPAQPKLVFFFDEAHLLFKDAPPALLEKVEQVVRLIRSKGVGVYFVTQNPLDIPDTVLGQLGNRVQHALRAFTPRDQKAVRTAAQTMRPNPGLDLEAAITELGVGEALVSLLDDKGRPGITRRAWIAAPGSRIGPATPEERAAVAAGSLVGSTYEQTVDRQSAYEMLQQRAAPQAAPAGKAGGDAQAGTQATGGQGGGWLGSLQDLLFGTTGPRGGKRDGVVQTMAKSTARSLGNQIARGILGSLTGGRRR